MGTSLDEVTSNLLKGGIENFKQLLKNIDNKSIFWTERNTVESTKTIIDSNWNVKFDKRQETVFKDRKKGIFRYEFVDSCEFNYKELLTKQDFYDNSNKKSITDQEYEQYVRVWNSIEDVDLGKYSDLYLKIDVLALADVFEVFRDTTIKSHQLDSVYYYTVPGLSFDVMLHYTKGIRTTHRLQNVDNY